MGEHVWAARSRAALFVTHVGSHQRARPSSGAVCAKRKKSSKEGASGRGRSAKREGLYRSLDSYVEHFLRLCRLDFEAELEVVRQARSVRTLDSLYRDGLVLLGLFASDGGSFFADRVIKLTLASNENLPRHLKFSQGDLVELSRGEETVSATVLERTTRFLSVVPESADFDVIGGGWRVDRGSSSITYERLCAALENVKTSGKTQSADEVVNMIGASFDSEQVIDTRARLSSWTDTAKVDVAQGAFESKAKQLPPRFSKGVKQQAGLLAKDLPKLSRTQTNAVEEALCRRLTLIQGPPGTGKTYTACAIVRALVQMRGGPVLVSAASNTATDNLLEGLAGLNAVRIGRAVSVRESLRWLTLEARVARHPTVADLYTRLRSAEKRGAGPEVRAARGALRDAEARVSRKVLMSAQVIIATCGASGADILEELHIPAVVIDEATQATEPATLLPILHGCEQLVLVGDHHQLPPTVVSKEAAQRALDVSLFSRLWAIGTKVLLLNMQYRMHPLLAKFPSDTFYGGQLTTAVRAEDRAPPRPLPWTAAESGLLFVRVAASETAQGTSYANLDEADAVVMLVRIALSADDLTPHQVGVITPYAAQVRAISLALEKAGIDSGSLEVSTVDGFQGREKELILFSAVRANEARTLGFTSDWRRLNVSLTRAKRGLVVVGNERTLSNDAVWKRWIQFARVQNFCLRSQALTNYLGQ